MYSSIANSTLYMMVTLYRKISKASLRASSLDRFLEISEWWEDGAASF